MACRVKGQAQRHTAEHGRPKVRLEKVEGQGERVARQNGASSSRLLVVREAHEDFYRSWKFSSDGIKQNFIEVEWSGRKMPSPASGAGRAVPKRGTWRERTAGQPVAQSAAANRLALAVGEGGWVRHKYLHFLLPIFNKPKKLDSIGQNTAVPCQKGFAMKARLFRIKSNINVKML